MAQRWERTEQRDIRPLAGTEHFASLTAAGFEVGQTGHPSDDL